MLLTEAPSLRTLRSRAPLVWREGGRSGPPLPPPPTPPLPPPPPSSPSPRSDGSGSESERRDEVEGGDKWSTEPTGDVADSDICNPARLCGSKNNNNNKKKQTSSSSHKQKYIFSKCNLIPRPGGFTPFVVSWRGQNGWKFFILLFLRLNWIDVVVHRIRKKQGRLTRIWRDSSCEVSVYQSASPSSGAAPRSITTWARKSQMENRKEREREKMTFSSMILSNHKMVGSSTARPGFILPYILATTMLFWIATLSDRRQIEPPGYLPNERKKMNTKKKCMPAHTHTRPRTSPIRRPVSNRSLSQTVISRKRDRSSERRRCE